MATYIVKPGDTLSKIGAQLGVDWKQITGYRSGNPKLIYPGEVLTIPTATPTPTPTEQATEIRNQLEGETTKPSKIETEIGKFTNGEYDIGKIQTSLSAASTEKKKAYDAMVGLQTSLYNTEYQKANLADVKTKITNIDTDITNRKAQRDQMLLDEMGKPIPQWMITGRKKLEIDAATNDLNRLIDQRNSLASEYNTGLANVSRKVEYGVKDAATKYAYWENEESRLSNLSRAYQSVLASELSRKERAKQWEKDYAIKLEELGIRKEEAGRKGGGIKQYALQPVYKKDFMGRPTDEIIGYFDPATGETTIYTSGGTPTPGGTPAPTEGISWAGEADVRAIVNEGLNSGKSADDLKSALTNVRLGDSAKTASQIVDEEVRKQSGGESIWSKIWHRLPFVK